MTLTLRKDRNDDVSGRWFHVGRSRDGRLIGWTDGDEAEIPFLGSIQKGGRVKVRPFGNRAFEQAQAHLERRHRRFRQKDGQLPEHIQRRVLFEAAAREILEDWEGVAVGEDGEPEPYSWERGLKALEESAEFESLVVSLSSDLAEQRRSALQEDGETLGNGSSGKSDGAGKPGTRRPKSG